MSRPPFSMKDDQARALVQRVGPLLDQYPLDAARRDHRPFCGAFMRAVYEVTGKLYGPDIYRRLLKAYAPGRSPSTTTLASERDNLECELKQSQVAAPAADGAAPRTTFSYVDGAAAADRVRAALAEFLPQLARVVSQSGKDAEFNFLVARLNDVERGRDDAQAHAARLGSELQEQLARADLLASQLELCQAALTREQELVKRLTDEIAGQRTFALQSIELSRAETRLYRERAASFEQQVRGCEMTIDQLRIARGNAHGGGQR